MTANPFAGAARIGWMEFWSHLKSLRFLILVVLVALLVFGVSYGMTQTTPAGLYNTPSLSVYGAVRNESALDHYLVIGWVADMRGVPEAGATVSVYEQNSTQPVANPMGSLLTTVKTNASGFATYDIGTSVPESVSYAMAYGEYNFGSAGFYFTTTNATFLVNRVVTSTTSGPMGTESAVSLQVMATDGYPATTADVYLDGNFSGHPDSNGFYSPPHF